MGGRRSNWFGFAFLALVLLLVPLKWLLAAIVAASVHELGHFAALRHCGVEISQLRFDIGGAKMKVGCLGRGQEFVCSLAGPVAGLCLVLFARWMPRTAVCACIQSAYNLLPIYPLDGGRAFRCLVGDCGRKWTEVACLCLIGLCGVVGSFIFQLGLLPIGAACLTIHRALEGKGLAKPLGFRYNRGRIYE